MAKSKEELIYDIENNLVDPTTNKITGERVKARLLDMVDAMGSGSGAMEYWKAGDATISYSVALFCPIVKAITAEVTNIVPGAMLPGDTDFPILAIAFDRTYRYVSGGEPMTFDDLLTILGWDDSNYIQITEEEFYTI